MCISCTYVYLLHCVCIAVFFTAGLLARSQYSEGPATDHLDTGFSWFPCVYKQMLRWFPRFQVGTVCFSCSPPDLNFVVTNLMVCIHVKNHCHRVTTQLQLINIIMLLRNVENFVPDYVPSHRRYRNLLFRGYLLKTMILKHRAYTNPPV